MPIRINLLAEAQAQEDMRRRDPVKRAIWVGVFLVILMLAWSSSLQLKALISKGELNRVEAQLNSRTNEYAEVLANQKALNDVSQRLVALNRLASGRLLHGTILNALQQTTVQDVELVRLRSEIAHSFTEEIKAKTNANRSVTPGRPATVTERAAVFLEARDIGSNPGDQVNRFKQTVSDFPYFKEALGATNEARLASLSPPQVGPDGKSFVLFTLECRYPEKTR
jgi:hypothetical protein